MKGKKISPIPNLFIIFLIATIVYLAFEKTHTEKVQTVSEYQLEENIKNGKINEIIFLPSNDSSNYQWVSGKIKNSQIIQKAITINPERFLNIIEKYNQKLPNNPIKYKTEPQSNFLGEIIKIILPTLLIFFLIYLLLFRQIKKANSHAFEFAKNKAKKIEFSKEDVSFKDIAGIDEACDEMQEVVSFLKNPKKFHEIGAQLPKGCLLVGPPGTGKTLIARAIAGEADVPFFYVSGSDFVEMFVGVGASRVRSLFEEAKKNQPCIVFIDEIDAIGGKRTSGRIPSGGHDEKEQTLNALLVEMDGFEKNDNIIIIGATNRDGILDPALLRPGRFNRKITVDLPDLQGRKEILKIHSKKISLHEEVDLKQIARGTVGFSGADLANLVNEAAIIAVSNKSPKVKMNHLEESRDKVCWGRERKSRTLTKKEQILTAYHESGHVLVSLYCPHSIPLHKVTIIPRGTSYLGAAIYLPENDSLTKNKNELLDSITVAMGGRVAEEMTFGTISNGAYSDIKQATLYAKKMVKEWGMSELGFISYEEDPNYLFNNTYSEKVSEQIDREVKKIIDIQYEKAKKILKREKCKLISLAEELLKKETMSAKEIYKFLKIEKKEHLQNILKKITASFFITYYEQLKNRDISSITYRGKTREQKINSALEIFKNKQEMQLLDIILNSSNLKASLLEKAQRISSLKYNG